MMKETFEDTFGEISFSAFLKRPFYQKLAMRLLSGDEAEIARARLEAITLLITPAELTPEQWCAIFYTFEHAAYIAGGVAANAAQFSR